MPTQLKDKESNVRKKVSQSSDCKCHLSKDTAMPTDMNFNFQRHGFVDYLVKFFASFYCLIF